MDKGRESPALKEPTRSVEDIPRVELDLVAGQQFEQFFLECPPPVMPLLPLDVRRDALGLRLADAEDAVPLLPREPSGEQPVVVDPFGRAGLDVAEEVGNGLIGLPACQQVDVVGDAADFEQRAALITDDPADELVEACRGGVGDRARSAGRDAWC